MIYRILISLALLIFGAQLTFAESANQNETVAINIGGTPIIAPIPAGYCIPSGKFVTVAQLLAAVDRRNVTHATFYACADGKNIDKNADYILLKTPNEALIAKLTLNKLLTEIGSVFDNTFFIKAINSEKMDHDLEKSMKSVLHTDVNAAVNIRPLGKDDRCAYMGGTAKLEGSGLTSNVAVGLCMTVVGDRLISINYYGSDTSIKGVVNLTKKAKAYAQSLRVGD